MGGARPLGHGRHSREISRFIQRNIYSIHPLIASPPRQTSLPIRQHGRDDLDSKLYFHKHQSLFICYIPLYNRITTISYKFTNFIRKQ